MFLSSTSNAFIPPMPSKYAWSKQGCKNSHSVLLHGAEHVFSESTSSGSQLQDIAESSSKTSTIAAAKTCIGLLQTAEVNIGIDYEESLRCWILEVPTLGSQKTLLKSWSARRSAKHSTFGINRKLTNKTRSFQRHRSTS